MSENNNPKIEIQDSNLEKEIKPKKIFIIEDEESMISFMERSLKYAENKHEAIFARTIEDARKLFEDNHQDIGLIVIDACLGGDTPNTPQLIKEIRASGFTGHIITASSDASFNQALMDAGADCLADKLSARKKMMQILEEETSK